MNILFLEDRASATELIENYLRSAKRHNVFTACNVYEANSIIEKNNIECFVIDLNLAPNGHTLKRKDSSLFSGWIWIIDVVIKKFFQSIRSDEKLPIIIYSEFISDFDKQYDEFHLDNIEDWAFFKQIEKVKKFEENTSQNLLNAIESVNKQLNSKR